MCGRVGVSVSECLSSVHTCLPLPACLPAGLGCLPTCLGCLPLPACLGACLGCLLGACLPWVPAGLGCLYAYLDQIEFVAIFLFSSDRVDSVAQRIHVGSKIGHSHSEMEGSRPAAPALSMDRRADGDVRRPGGLARDERSDNSCWRKLRVLTPHECEESCL